MIETHELVVPRSIPITSPTSVLFHRCADDADDPHTLLIEDRGDFFAREL